MITPKILFSTIGIIVAALLLSGLWFHNGWLVFSGIGIGVVVCGYVWYVVKVNTSL